MEKPQNENEFRTSEMHFTFGRLQRLCVTSVLILLCLSFGFVVYGPTRWSSVGPGRWDFNSVVAQPHTSWNWKQSLFLEASQGQGGSMTLGGNETTKSAKKFLTIGISTVYREEEYLKTTLQSLVNQSWPEERQLATIVIFLADTDEERRDLQQKLVEDNFRPELISGFIQIIRAPPSIYPPFDFVLHRRTYDDSIDRVIWRTKQVIDFVFLFTYVRSHDLSEYHVVAEDDILASNQYLTAIQDFLLIKKRDNSKWSALQFAKFVGIGLLFKTKDLEKLTEFLIIFHKEHPVDVLMKTFTALENPNVPNSAVVNRNPSIFQHIGKKSTLPNKVQELTDDSFGQGVRKFENLKNPPAVYISSTFTTLEDCVPENAYSAAPGWFDGTSKSSQSQTFDVIYKQPIEIERIAVFSGRYRIEHGAKLLTASHLNSENALEKGCSDLNLVGNFENGDIDVVLTEETKVQCIQIQIPAQPFVTITEIKVFQKT